MRIWCRISGSSLRTPIGDTSSWLRTCPPSRPRGPRIIRPTGTGTERTGIGSGGGHSRSGKRCAAQSMMMPVSSATSRAARRLGSSPAITCPPGRAHSGNTGRPPTGSSGTPTKPGQVRIFRDCSGNSPSSLPPRATATGAQTRSFSHLGHHGVTAHRRMAAAGYPGGYTGENIYSGSRGYQRPGDAVHSWMNSPGHRRAMLDRTFSKAAIGIHEGTLYGYGRGYFTTLLLC